MPIGGTVFWCSVNVYWGSSGPFSPCRRIALNSKATRRVFYADVAMGSSLSPEGPGGRKARVMYHSHGRRHVRPLSGRVDLWAFQIRVRSGINRPPSASYCVRRTRAHQVAASPFYLWQAPVRARHSRFGLSSQPCVPQRRGTPVDRSAISAPLHQTLKWVSQSPIFAKIMGFVPIVE